MMAQQIKHSLSFIIGKHGDAYVLLVVSVLFIIFYRFSQCTQWESGEIQLIDFFRQSPPTTRSNE